jgi:hypothetical protein
MLYEEKELPELYYMKHRHDNNNMYIDYENSILDRSLSPHMYKNDMMNNFLKRLQPLTAKLFDQMNIMKNFQNYMVDKYYYKHPK